MELILFSDSHGRSSGIRMALARGGADAVIHLGDGVRDVEPFCKADMPLYAVRGNCDLFEERPEEIVMALGGRTVLMTHGHLYGAKSGVGGLLRRAREVKADVVLFGHTHRVTELLLPTGTPTADGPLERDVYLFNPGSIGQSTDGRGPSFGRLLLRPDGVLFSVGRI